MVDIQKKLSEGKGTGYEKWAKIHNLKQAAKTVNFLSEHGLSSPEELETALNEAAAALDAAGISLKELERRICGNREQKARVAKLQRVKSNLHTILRQEQAKDRRKDLDR